MFLSKNNTKHCIITENIFFVTYKKLSRLGSRRARVCHNRKEESDLTLAFAYWV